MSASWCSISIAFSRTRRSSCMTMGIVEPAHCGDTCMKWSVGVKIAIGFGVALVIFVIVGAASYASATRQSEDGAWVTHTHAVRDAVTDLLLSLQNTESAER